MYYIVQEKLFQENEWDDLIKGLERLGLEYEVVKLIPFIDDIEFKTKRKDIFCFGSLKMARMVPKYGWNPGIIMTPNHDFQVYREYYKDNLLNYDSKIYKFGEDFDWNGDFFIRPTLDTKTFTGKVHSMESWKKFRDEQLTNGHTTTLTKDTDIQVCSIKNIQKEFRFYIVDGYIVTASLYREGSFVRYSDIIDDEATEYCRDMIDVFNLATAFVMDICLTDNQWKIMEIGTINCCGLYKSNISKLLMALEDYFERSKVRVEPKTGFDSTSKK
jgi:hypothetical protein